MDGIATKTDDEFDPDKSAANRDKHGIDFVEAKVSWSGFGVKDRLDKARRRTRDVTL